MAWHARLSLALTLQGARCIARFEHEGPLRILQTLYPEGDAIAHNVLVHPPSGLVGGDELSLDLRAGAGTHGLVTTPGASRFYRSAGEAAVQRTRITLDEGARFEWLPLEAICYSGCIAQNHLALALAPGAELIGWDVVALGLPESNLPFERGSLLQDLSLGDRWLERGRIAAGDSRLMDGALGLAGQRCLATLFFASGSGLSRSRRDLALDAARAVIDAHPLASMAGATSPAPGVVLVRVLGPLVEPVLGLLKAIRAAWRPALWSLEPVSPRTWAS
jgi:urease accessory protein